MLKYLLTAVSVYGLVLPATSGASTLYRCTDKAGHATYTNYKPGDRNCTILSRDNSATRASGNGSSVPSPKTSAKRPTPADFPKVANDTQRSRDGDRRYILEQELAAEQRGLDEAKKSLNTQPATSNAAPSQPIRDRIAMHQRNLDALQREISRLK